MSGSPSNRNAANINSLSNFFSSKGTYTPPAVPGAAPTGNVTPETTAMPNQRGGPVNMEGSTNTNYQELPNESPPAPSTPARASNEITNSNNNRNEQPSIAGSFRYGTATTSASNVGIQWGILIALSAIPLAIWAFAPSYGNTILTAFFTSLSIFGGFLCMIAAVSIMMNIYKTDGAPIMLMMGFLGMFASPFIVIGYWIYHVWAWTRSVKPRPYFGLFPIGFHGTPGSFWDSFLAPFHDSSNDKKLYEALVTDAKSLLYGGPRD